MNRQKSVDYWVNFVQNQEKLESCLYHEFTIEVILKKKTSSEWKCIHCEGMVDEVNKKWYEKGMKHKRQKKEKEEENELV